MKYYIDTTNLIYTNNKINWKESIKGNKSIFYFKSLNDIYEIKLISNENLKDRHKIIVSYNNQFFTTSQQSLLNGHINKIVNSEIKLQKEKYINNENKYSVYVHVNKINQKMYIGITSVCPYLRWKNGNGYIDQMFYRAIKKYGWNNFEHIILIDNLSKEFAEIIEYELIKKYQSNNPKFGYNISNGGEIHKVSEYTKKKMSKQRKGIKLSKEWVLSRTVSQTGLKRSKETCQRISNATSVQVISISSVKRIIYKSITEAERTTKCSASHISQCCHKKRNYVGKDEFGNPFHWMFYSEYIEKGYDKLLNEQILPKLTNVGRKGIPIIDKQTGVIYKSIRFASIQTGISQEKIKEDLVCSSDKWEYGNILDEDGEIINA